LEWLRSQHSSHRLILSASRRFNTLVAPVSVQNILDSFKLWPMTDLHPPQIPDRDRFYEHLFLMVCSK